MRVAVTGGSGLIGRAVIESGLKQGHAFVNIDRVAPPAGSRRGRTVRAGRSD